MNTVLLELGLEHIANRRIGNQYRRGVSGGEKRRISIGIALVGRPKILVMDEPLSGLDSVNAQRVISALRALASGPEHGTTIIMTVHQPSSFIFESFDNVLLMSHGRVLYHGTPADSVAWCETHGDPVPRNHNPADHLLQIAFTDLAERLPPHQHDVSAAGGGGGSSSSATPSETNEEKPSAVARFSAAAASSRATFSSPLSNSKPVATTFTQVGLLARRSFQNAWRDRAGAVAHIGGVAVVGLITGGAFWQVNQSIAGFQNRIGSIFFLLLLMTFAGLSAMTLLNRARPLMARERGNGLYNPFSWLLSHVIVSHAACSFDRQSEGMMLINHGHACALLLAVRSATFAIDS